MVQTPANNVPANPTLYLRAFRTEVTPATADEIVQVISQPGDGVRLVLNHNLHSVYLYQNLAQLRELYAAASLIVIDGAPVLGLAKIAGPRQGLGHQHRVGSTDWIAKLNNAPRPLRLFLYGAKPASNRDAQTALRAQLPGWPIAGIDGYVEEAIAMEAIRAHRPDLVLVGLGMPRQEEFLSRNFVHLPQATYATVGGAIDYVGGHNTLSPRWVGRIGLEWLWRLSHEPLRLSHRYIVEPLLLVPFILRNLRRPDRQ